MLLYFEHQKTFYFFVREIGRCMVALYGFSAFYSRISVLDAKIQNDMPGLHDFAFSHFPDNVVCANFRTFRNDFQNVGRFGRVWLRCSHPGNYVCIHGYQFKKVSRRLPSAINSLAPEWVRFDQLGRRVVSFDAGLALLFARL